jgi:hypothetical protein
MQALDIHRRLFEGSGAAGNVSGFGDSDVSVFGPMGILVRSWQSRD